MRRGPLLPLRALYTRPLMFCAALFGLGALLARDGRMPLWPLLALSGAFLLAWLLAWRLGGRRLSALLAACLLFLGAARMTHAVNAQPSLEDRFSIALRGTIADAPLVDGEIDRLSCRLTDVRVDGEPLGFDVRLYLRGPESALCEVAPGQTISTTGHLWAPDAATNPGEFDFGAYLWREGLAAYATAYWDDAVLEGEPSGLAARMHTLRTGIGRRIDALFPRSASVVRALVLGDRLDMDEDLRASFDRAGITHVLSISGLHITMLAMAAMAALSLVFPRRWAFWGSLALVLFYAYLVGMAPSVQRAVVMYAALGSGQALGRPTDSYTRLSLAFFALVALNPLNLSDAGFVLSFSACAGMLCLSPPLLRLVGAERAFASRRPKSLRRRALRYVLSALCATLAAQLATLPAVLAYYGEVPLFATLGNLALVPLIMLGMYLSVAALLLSAAWMGAAVALAVVSDLLLALSMLLTRLLGRLPFGMLSLPAFPWWLTAVYALAIVAASELTRLRMGARYAALAALPALVCVAVFALAPRGVQIVFLDAGQADAAVVLAEGEAYLVDVGLEDGPVDEYLSHAGIRPTAAFLSHPHADHAGGLNALSEENMPETLYVPAGWNDVEADESVRQGVARAEALGARVVMLHAGDTVQLSESATATVLYPPEDMDARSDANDISMLLKIDYGDASALFTGDLEIPDETGPMPDVDVLKVAHHGSDDASSYRMLYSARPSAAVICVGADNSYGHPGEALLARLAGTGAQIYRTDLDGAVTVRLHADGSVAVQTFIPREEGT